MSSQSLSTSTNSSDGSARSDSAPSRIRAWAAARTAATRAAARAASRSRPEVGDRLGPSAEQVAGERLDRRRAARRSAPTSSSTLRSASISSAQRLAGDPGVDVVRPRAALGLRSRASNRLGQRSPQLGIGRRALDAASSAASERGLGVRERQEDEDPFLVRASTGGAVSRSQRRPSSRACGRSSASSRSSSGQVRVGGSKRRSSSSRPSSTVGSYGASEHADETASSVACFEDLAMRAGDGPHGEGVGLGQPRGARTRR